MTGTPALRQQVVREIGHGHQHVCVAEVDPKHGAARVLQNELDARPATPEVRLLDIYLEYEAGMA